MTILQTIAVWSLIISITGMSITAIQHNYRRKQLDRRRQRILRDRYF